MGFGFWVLGSKTLKTPEPKGLGFRVWGVGLRTFQEAYKGTSHWALENPEILNSRP